MDEILEPYLVELRNYAMESGNRELYEALLIFQYRFLDSSEKSIEGQVLQEFDIDWDIAKLSWETLLETAKEEKEFENINLKHEDHVKLLFLIAWMEEQLWQLGENNDQYVSDLSEIPDEELKENRFVWHGQSSLSKKAAQNFKEKWFSRWEQKDAHTKNFPRPCFDKKISESSLWRLLVSPKLKEYYYENQLKAEDIRTNDTFLGLLESINFQINKEPKQAAIANALSWFMLGYNWKQSQINPNSSGQRPLMNNKDKAQEFRKNYKRLYEEASNDNTTVTSEIKTAIKRIATETGFNGLSQNEKSMLYKKAKTSPKIHLAIRKARMTFRMRQHKKSFAEAYLKEKQQQQTVFIQLADKLRQTTRDLFLRVGETLSGVTVLPANQLALACDRKGTDGDISGQPPIYSIWDRICFHLPPALTSGYVTILNGPESGDFMDIAYPACAHHNTAVSEEGGDYHVTVTGYCGRQVYRVIWTREPLFDINIDFTDKEERRLSLEAAMTALVEMNPKDWCQMTHTIDVVELPVRQDRQDADGTPRYQALVPPQAKYNTLILHRQDQQDGGVVLADNAPFPSGKRTEEVTYDVNLYFRAEDIGEHILYMLITTDRLDIASDEIDISLNRFNEIFNQVDIYRGDVVERIQLTIHEKEGSNG